MPAAATHSGKGPSKINYYRTGRSITRSGTSRRVERTLRHFAKRIGRRLWTPTRIASSSILKRKPFGTTPWRGLKRSCPYRTSWFWNQHPSIYAQAEVASKQRRHSLFSQLETAETYSTRRSILNSMNAIATDATVNLLLHYAA